MKKITYVALLALLVTACKKNPNDAPYYTIEPELKAFFNYQMGSYWVFMDTTSGQVDSFAVSGYTIDKYNQHSGYNQEQAYVGIKQYQISSLPPYTSNYKWYLTISPGQTELNMTPQNSGIIIYHPFTSGMPFQLGALPHSDPGDGSRVGLTVSFWPTYSVIGSVYDSVYQLHFDYNSSNEVLQDDIYINRKDGFLQLKLNNAYQQKNWQLIKHQLVQ